MRVFKDISIEHTNKFQDLSENVNTYQIYSNEEIKKINKELQLVKCAMIKLHEDSMISIEGVNSGILSEINKFKSNLLIDLDYKQKNNDSKIAYLEEQVFHIRKFTNSLPTMVDIENKIIDACADLKFKLKSEIKDHMLMPEIRGLAYDIRDSSQ